MKKIIFAVLFAVAAMTGHAQVTFKANGHVDMSKHLWEPMLSEE